MGEDGRDVLHVIEYLQGELVADPGFWIPGFAHGPHVIRDGFRRAPYLTKLLCGPAFSVKAEAQCFGQFDHPCSWAVRIYLAREQDVVKVV